MGINLCLTERSIATVCAQCAKIENMWPNVGIIELNRALFDFNQTIVVWNSD